MRQKGAEVDIIKNKSNKGLYFNVYQAAYRTDLLTLQERSVFFAIKSYVPIGQNTGVAFPGIEKIAAAALVSVRTAKTCLKNLAKKGFIHVERRGLGKTNIYTINDCPELWEDGRTNEERENIVNNEAALISTEDMLAELARRGIYIPTSTPESAENSAIEPHAEPTEEQTEETTGEPQEEPQRATEGPQFANDKLLDIDDLQPQGAKLSEYAEAYPEQAEDIERARQIINDIINDNSNRPVYVNKQPKGLQTVKAVYIKLQLWQILAALARTNQLGNKITNYKALLTSNLYLAAFTDKQQDIDRSRAREEREEAERRRVQAEQMRIDGITPEE